MPDKLSIYNNTLLICGESALANLTENREPRRVLDQVWDSDFLRRCLEQGDWNFAMRSVKLEPSTSVEPDFGHPLAYEKPSDWVRTAAFCSDEFFNSPITQYSDEAGYWFCSQEPIYVQYVSNDASYGLDLSKWPDSYTNWVEHALARRIHKRLTNAATDNETLKRDERRALSDARMKDARNQGAQFRPAGSWVKARRGSSGLFYDRKEGR